MSEQTSKVFFPSLNGLRFIAAFAVVIHHLEQIKLFFGFENLFFKWYFIKIVGELGVTLFFTLSGFLITYLLLAEKNRFKTISVKRFYIRRMLRIWPLYYALIILGLFVFPNFHFFDIPGYADVIHYKFGTKIFFYAILFPNIVSNLYSYMPFIAQTWSIGIEEQFYLMWPWIVKFSRRYLAVLLTIVIAMLLITNVLSFYADHSPDISQTSTETKIITFAYKFFAMLRIGCMAIGAIGAYFLFNSNMNVLRPIFQPIVQVFTLGVVLIMMFLGVEIPYVNYEVYSLFFIVIILNLAANPKSLFSLEYKWLDYLGQMSYSIYMWHNVAIIFAMHTARYFSPKLETYFSNTVYYSVTFILTFVFSVISYEIFEKQFLKYKNRFAKIESGNSDTGNNTEGDIIAEKNDKPVKKHLIDHF